MPCMVSQIGRIAAINSVRADSPKFVNSGPIGAFDCAAGKRRWDSAAIKSKKFERETVAEDGINR